MVDVWLKSTGDINGDGRLDVVAGCRTAGGLVWYQNPGWEAHSIGSTVLHDFEVADFDGDGDADLVGRNQGAFGQKGDQLHFYRQDSPSAWTHKALEIADGEGLAVSDMDGDADLDLYGATGAGSQSRCGSTG